ncbi:Mobile element protein [hydrothermal vent metagenome]|uniref:Mobile element protein n=1 Tax=hydrothermal vent metagenome TaxID=652676 RepID=A0A3B0YYF6_9ZZZZ
MTESFDFERALKDLQSGKDLTGKEGILTPLIKQLTEAALQGELDAHLAQEIEPNRKNGSTSKTIKSGTGCFELDTPRDRVATEISSITFRICTAWMFR